jgi:hypothetical protein
MLTGPMVFLDNLTRADAIKLTIKLDNKRGGFNQTKLRELVRGFDTPPETLSLELGFNTSDLQNLLGVPTLPNSQFTETHIDAKVEYCCPNCSHKWSGEKKPKKK